MIRQFEGHVPAAQEAAFVADNAVVIGQVSLGAQASIWYGCVLRGDVGRITIGARTNIQDLSVIHVTSNAFDTHIAHDVSVGHRVILHGCRVADHVLVGMGAVLMDGVDVGPYCFIAAGALLTPGKKYPPRSLIMGAPARVVRSVEDEEIATIERTAALYIELGRRHGSSLG